MPDLQDGETVEVQGSAAKPYLIRNVGGVYSCSCPAWRNQSLPIERRTCKHLIRYCGAQAEAGRVAAIVLDPPSPPAEQKTQAPPLMLAESWDTATDPAGWWLSEKLDGVRAWWTGTCFQSRQGNTFHAPAWFIAGLPKLILDGELWLARKAFQRTVSIVRRHDGPDSWRDIKFRIFDVPMVSGPFEDRIEYVCDVFSQLEHPHASVLPQMRCRGIDHLRDELDHIAFLGGEGLMLRQPGSRYEGGRSATLLKVKQFHDAEGRVIGHQPGRGRHKGRLGALLVALANGTEFAVGIGFTDAQREQAPAIGSTITFRYQELTDGGVPRFPSFVCVSTDAVAVT